MTTRAVRAPASSANLGAGFDVFAMALDAYADVGVDDPPEGAQVVDEHHPARHAFTQMGGTGQMWLRCKIPMARGLGFSGAVRVAAASLAAVQLHDDPAAAIAERSADILRVATDLEQHGDNAAASLFGGVTAFVDGRSIAVPIGPRLAHAAFVAWVPDVTTSTDRSRASLPSEVTRADAVFNLGRAVQFALAFAHDDPSLLAGATDDALHQAWRLPLIDGAAEALDAGVAAGAWCGWLSGSGPTVGFLVDPEVAPEVAGALPAGGHVKFMSIDRRGARLLD
ncbi:MAG: homoserine kinase [Ilumatobacter sp.]|jgi:homoserine kinase|uniref:homoserine kinase n=1 Tax=Ilumatobacter sp. TaxID=1967498 RepID=UPI003918CF49